MNRQRRLGDLDFYIYYGIKSSARLMACLCYGYSLCYLYLFIDGVGGGGDGGNGTTAATGATGLRRRGGGDGATGATGATGRWRRGGGDGATGRRRRATTAAGQRRRGRRVDGDGAMATGVTGARHAGGGVPVHE